MNKTHAKQDQRLDQIFFLFYEDKSLFTDFLKTNKTSLKNPILSGGEAINLPELEQIQPNQILKSPLLEA